MPVRVNPFTGLLEQVAVGSKGDKGDPGDPGPQGPEGPQGPAGGAYRHVQGVPASTWMIVHNLGFFPGGIAARDSGGELREGYVEYLDINTLRISFFASGTPVAFSGEAFVS